MCLQGGGACCKPWRGGLTPGALPLHPQQSLIPANSVLLQQLEHSDTRWQVPPSQWLHGWTAPIWNIPSALSYWTGQLWGLRGQRLYCLPLSLSLCVLISLRLARVSTTLPDSLTCSSSNSRDQHGRKWAGVGAGTHKAPCPLPELQASHGLHTKGGRWQVLPPRGRGGGQRVRMQDESEQLW